MCKWKQFSSTACSHILFWALVLVVSTWTWSPKLSLNPLITFGHKSLQLKVLHVYSYCAQTDMINADHNIQTVLCTFNSFGKEEHFTYSWCLCAAYTKDTIRQSQANRQMPLCLSACVLSLILYWKGQAKPLGGLKHFITLSVSSCSMRNLINPQEDARSTITVFVCFFTLHPLQLIAGVQVLTWRCVCEHWLSCSYGEGYQTRRRSLSPPR